MISTNPFATLSEKFLARCRGELVVLRDMAGSGAAADRDILLKIAHSLAGAGGTFGFRALSEHASRLETILVADTEDYPSDVEVALNTLIDEMERILA